MDFQPLKYIYRPASDKNAYTLLLLHGTGGDEIDLLPLADNFGSNINVLSLRGNVSEAGMPRFFRRLGMGIFDEKDLEFRTGEMLSFLEKLATEKDFSLNKLIALGYSNGANIAGSILSLYPDLLSGAVLYRPMQPYKVMPDNNSLKRTPVFISHGIADPTIDPAMTRHYLHILTTNGFDVESHTVNAGHNLSAGDIERSVLWYQKKFGNGAV